MATLKELADRTGYSPATISRRRRSLAPGTTKLPTPFLVVMIRRCR